jgi:hypothetical protein
MHLWAYGHISYLCKEIKAMRRMPTFENNEEKPGTWVDKECQKDIVRGKGA